MADGACPLGEFFAGRAERANEGWPWGGCNFVWREGTERRNLGGSMSDVNNLMAVRLNKRAELDAAGSLPYGAAFSVEGDVGEVRAAFADGKKVSLAGRVPPAATWARVTSSI